ncbi:MAG: hypothetical protein K1V76_03545 [Candidatus Amulumruptor sp.]
MSDRIIEKTEELQALYDCYCALEKSGLTDTIYTQGQFAIYEKMRSIINDDEIYPIAAKAPGIDMSDYIWHVKTDTPNMIDALQSYIETI